MLKRGQNKWKHLNSNMEKSDVTQGLILSNIRLKRKKEIETFKLLKEQNSSITIISTGTAVIKKMHSYYLLNVLFNTIIMY